MLTLWNPQSLRFAAFFTLITFTFQQVSSAQTLQNDGAFRETVLETPTLDPEGAAVSASGMKPLQPDRRILNSLDFLQGESPLSRADEAVPVHIKETFGEASSRGYERYSFEDAIEELRPEYASAVIVENVTEDNLRQLLELEFETALVVLHGEIVLLTSGNKNEILTTEPAARILDQADFISHTHPLAEQSDGPSALDRQLSRSLEYVITTQTAYGYDSDSLEDVGYAGFLEALRVKQRLSRFSEGEDSVRARSELNRFIAEMDQINSAIVETRLFRSSEPVVAPPVPVRVYSAARMAGNFVGVNVNGQPALSTVKRGFNLVVIHEVTGAVIESRSFDTYISTAESDAMAAFIEAIPNGRFVAAAVLDEGSSKLTQRAKDALKTLGASSVQNLGWQQSYSLLGKKGLQPGQGIEKLEAVTKRMATSQAVPYSGNFPGGYVRTFEAELMGGNSGMTNWSNRTLLDEGVIYNQWHVPQAGNFKFEVRARGTLGNGIWPLMELRLDGQVIAGPVSVSTSTDTFYGFDNVAIPEGPHEIQIAYINEYCCVNGDRNLIVDKLVVTKLAGSPVVTPETPIVSAIPAFTNQNTVTLSGTKQPGTSVWINGVEKVPAGTSTAWSITETLSGGEGLKSYSVAARNSAGVSSAAVTVSTTLDQTAPHAALSLNSGNLSTQAPSISAALTAQDSLSGLHQVRYQVNGVWSGWENFSASRSLILSGADGVKEVVYEVKDKAGNTRQASGSILLDTTAPSLNLILNGGQTYARSSSVQVEMTSADAGSGIHQMRYQVDGGSWSVWEDYAPSKTLILPSGDGLKEVRFEVRDKAGNAASLAKSITLDTTGPLLTSDSIYFSEKKLPDSSQLSHWSAEAIAGDKIPSDTAGGAVLSLVNGAVVSSEGPLLQRSNAQSLSFDGNNDFALADQAPLISGQSDFTYALWVKVNVIGGGAITDGNGDYIVDRSSETTPLVSLKEISGGKYGFQIRYNDGSGLGGPVGGTIKVNQWQHVVMVREYGKFFRLYVDGALVASVIDNGKSLNPPKPKFGLHATLSNNGLNGKIDEISIFSKAVSADDIRRLYEGFELGDDNAVGPTDSSSLSVDYKCDGILRSKIFYGLMQGENNLRIAAMDEAGNTTVIKGNVKVNLLDVETLSDGTVLYRTDGVLYKESLPSGDEIHYRTDGSVLKYRYADGREIHYSTEGPYELLLYGSQGNLLETLGHPAISERDEASLVRIEYDGGLAAYYRGDALAELVTSAGVRVLEPVLDAENNLRSGMIAYPDGSIDILRNGSRIRRVEKGGVTTDFLPSGILVRERSGGRVSTYQYSKASQSEITRTLIVSNQGDRVVYDDKGLLSEVQGSGGTLHYDRFERGSEWRLFLNLSESAVPEATTLVEGRFTSEGVPLELMLQNGTVIFYEDGRLSRVVNASGENVDYHYEFLNGFANGLTVSRAGTNFSYAADGFLRQIQTASGTITREAVDTDADGSLTDEEIINILLDETGGSRLTDFELDADGNILNGIIHTREGVKQRIQNGVLTGYETVDGKWYEVARQTDGTSRANLREWKFRDGTTAVYGGGTIAEILFPDGRRFHSLEMSASRDLQSYVEALPDGTEKHFLDKRLVKIVTAAGGVIHYGVDGRAEKLSLGNGESYDIEYSEDGEGNVLEIIFNGSASRRTYSADGALTRVLTKGVRAEFTGGEVERIFTRYGSVLGPVFDENGLLTGDIQFVDGAVQSVQNGLLTALKLDADTTAFYESGRLTRVQAAEGNYRLLYTDAADSLKGITLAFEGEVSWSRPLVPFLLENPDSDLAHLLLSKPVHNALAERDEVQSSFETGDSLYFARLSADSERGDVYGLGMDYLPYWTGLDLSKGYENAGYVQTNRTLRSWLDAPAKTSMLTDINGDGLADRVMLAGAGMNYWWVQLNSGQGLLSAVKWTGVDPSFNQGAMHYQDLLPRVFGTLLDINGDGLPDRVLQNFDGSPEWRVQFNNGAGFNPAVLWKGSAHALQQPAMESRFASEVWDDQGYQVAALTDLDGDGLADRVLRPYVAPFDRWFWQKNLGDGFADALLWEGVSLSFNQDPKTAASLSGYAEVQNNFETPAAAAIRQKIAEWDLAIAYFNTGCNHLTRNDLSLCRSNAASAMYAAAQKIQDTINAYGASYYAAYMDDPGVEFYSTQDYERYKNAALYAIRFFQTGFTDTSALIDLNGDGLPDRVLLKPQAGQSSTGLQEWWWQKNNGDGFDAPALWDGSVRALPGAPNAQAATSIHYVPGWLLYRDTLIDLRDVTGDGLPDRVTMDRHSPAVQAHTSWWVEVNTGSGFAPAVEWTGIYGGNSAQTSLEEDMQRFRHIDWGAYGPQMLQRAALKDISGDGIPDRVIFEQGSSHWKVQLGTGTGFLPVEEVLIETLSAPAEVNTQRYDYLHVSLKADTLLSPSLGQIKVTLGDPSDLESYQVWTIQDAGPSWKDYFLPLNPAKGNADQVHVEYIPASSQPSVPVYVDNLTFTGIRPPAGKDWLDRFLAQENVLSEIYSDRSQTLAQYLGYADAGQDSLAVSSGLLETLLNAETRLDFNDEGQLEEFETNYGTVSQVDGGRVTETVLPDGSRITFEAGEGAGSQTFTRTLQDSAGQTMVQELSYGRVRQVQREGRAALAYTYEFDTLGREITVVHDPESRVTERYREIAGASRILSRTEANGVVTVFDYDDEGRRTQSSVQYKGRVYETYRYGLSAEGLTTLETGNGVVEEYDSTGRIRFHITADGYRYAHTFEKARTVDVSTRIESVTVAGGEVLTFQVPEVQLTDCEQACEDVHRVSLLGYTSEDGTEAAYSAGDLASLKFSDGDRVFFSRSVVEEKTDEATGEPVSERRLMDVTVAHADGTATEYRNAKPYAVLKANGDSISLETEQGFLINPHESADFHYRQALKLWNEFVMPQWTRFLAPGALAVEIDYDASGRVVTRRFAEGATEIYEEGRILMSIGAGGERLMRYDYDADGNPVRIELEASRRRLESSVLRLKAEVALERQKALARLAEREQVLNQTIEGEYVVQRDRLLAIRAQLESQKNKVGAINVKGKAAKAAIGDAFSQIQAGVDQVDRALEKLARNRIDALNQLSSQVSATSSEIETSTTASYQEITAQESVMRESILRHEVSPVIYHWHRKILGRDPSRAEYDLWISRADYAAGTFDLARLKSELLTGGELAARTAEVNFIKNAVTQDLRQYVQMSDADRAAYASAFGLLPGKLVSLTLTESEKLLTWLNSRSLHFGQSAYLALEAMLSKAGLPFERRELARRLILIDILTGTLMPLEQDDLLISMFALKTAAKLYGLTGEGYALNYQALKALYDTECPPAVSNCAFRVIAHIDGNHYIIVTKVTADSVTYMETGSAASSVMDSVTMSKEEFEASWIDASNPENRFGYIFSAQPPPPAEITAQRAALMNDSTLMRVRGAFFELIAIAIIAVAKAVIATVAATVAAISTIVNSIVVGIGAILEGFGTLFTGVFSGNFLGGLQGLFHGLVSGVWQIATSVYQGIVAFGQTFSTVYGAGGLTFEGLKASGIAFLKTSAVAKFVSVTGISGLFQGAGKLLELMGVSPKISQTLMAGGKIITGAIMLGTGNIAGLGFLSGGSSEFLSLHTNLSPAISGLIGIGASALTAFAGGFGDLTGLAALKAVTPHLAMDLAGSGLIAVGNAINLDPRLTALVAVPVSASIGVGFSSLAAANTINGASVRAAIKNGMAALSAGQTLRGLANVGTTVGLNTAGVPSFAGDFIQGFLGSYAGGISGGSSPGGAGDVLRRGQDLLYKIGAGLKKFGTATANAIGSVVTFGQKVFEDVGTVTVQGFKKAISAFSSLFSRETQEGIYADQTNRREAAVTQNENVWTWQNGVNRIEYDAVKSELIEHSNAGGSTKVTGLGKDEAGRYFYRQLSVKEILDGDYYSIQNYELGTLKSVQYYYQDLPITALIGEGPDAWDVQGGLANGRVEGYFPIEIDASVILGNEEPSDNLVSVPFWVKIQIEDGRFTRANVDTAASAAVEAPAEPDREMYVLVNGILNDKTQTAPDYLVNLQDDIIERSSELSQADPTAADPVTKEDIIMAPTFFSSGIINAVAGRLSFLKAGGVFGALMDLIIQQTAKLLGNAAKDVASLIVELSDKNSNARLAAELKASLESHIGLNVAKRKRETVAVGYSGGFLPMAEVLSEPYAPEAHEGYNIESFVALGAATLNLKDTSRDLAVKVLEGAELILNGGSSPGVMSNILDEMVKVGSAVGFGQNVVEDILNFIAGKSPKEAYDYYLEKVKVLYPLLEKFSEGGIVSSTANLVVNVFGSKDILTEMAVNGQTIGGQRQRMGDFTVGDRNKPLINVEIVGASHFDYMRRGDFLSNVIGFFSPAFSAWNITVSNFVTDLILHADNGDRLAVFLAELEDRGLAENVSSKWVIRLPGFESR